MHPPMASFFLLGVILAALFFIISGLIIFISSSKSSNTQQTKLPPGTTGWPVIGESISFVSDTEKFVRDRMIKYSSDVFRTSIAGFNLAILCGPEGNKFIFSNDNKLMKPWWPPLLAEAMAESSPLSYDHSFLKIDVLQQYVSVMDSSCRDHLQKYWVPYKIVKAHHLAKKFTFSLSCRLFINYNDEQVKGLAEPFFAIFNALMSLPVNIPGTRYNSAMKGLKMIKKMLGEIIRERKQELRIGGAKIGKGDFLSTLLLAVEKKSGRFFSEEEIANKIISYLFASFVSTSNSITFILSHLADHPHVYNQVLEEQMGISKSKAAGELLKWGDINKMKYSWNVACESMRLMSFAGGFREVLTDFNFSGFRVPKGWKVFWTVYSTNKDSKYFPDHPKFDPSRFERDGAQPYTFVPFGGGPHMCRGKEYSRIAMLVFMHNIVTRFKIKRENPFEKVIYTPEPTPTEGLPLRLQAHKIEMNK